MPRRLLRLRNWIDLVAAQAALLRAQLFVWTRRRGTLLTARSRADGGCGSAPAPPTEQARRIARAVSWAARYGLFRPRCLVQALALQRLLRARGFSNSAVCIGVRRHNGTLLAHAWVEYRGAVLTGGESQQFVELARMDVERGTRSP